MVLSFNGIVSDDKLAMLTYYYIYFLYTMVPSFKMDGMFNYNNVDLLYYIYFVYIMLLSFKKTVCLILVMLIY